MKKIFEIAKPMGIARYALVAVCLLCTVLGKAQTNAYKTTGKGEKYANLSRTEGNDYKNMISTESKAVTDWYSQCLKQKTPIAGNFSAKERVKRKSPLSSVNSLVGPHVINSINLLNNADPETAGNSVEITKIDETTIAISNFTSEATNVIQGTVDLENGFVLIPGNQVLWHDDFFGDIILASLTDGRMDKEKEIEGIISTDGSSFFILTEWGDFIAEGTYAGISLSDGIWWSFITEANGIMDVTYNSSDLDLPTSYNVIINQNEGKDTISVNNFANHGQTVKMLVRKDGTVRIDQQLAWDRMNYTTSSGDSIGDYYTATGLLSLGLVISDSIKGTIDESAITLKNWVIVDTIRHSWLPHRTGTIRYIDSNKTFELPNEEIIQTTDFSVNDVTYTLNTTTKTAKVKLVTADRVDLVIPEKVSYNGTDYTVTALGDSIFHNNISNYYLYSATFPSTITDVAEKAFWWYEPAAIVWESETRLPEHSFDNFRYKERNFLLYVKKDGIAPTGVKNLVVNGVAGDIELVERQVFNCPREFTANSISYTHNYKMETGVGECAGWETIALPFDVQTVTHETAGTLIPFASYLGEEERLPFWLYSLSSRGFVKASAIKANTGYLISMPNNSSYSPVFNVPGKVTFAATNVTVKRTAAEDWNTSTYNDGTIYPCFSFYNMADYTYALNVTNDFVTNTAGGKAGRVFLSNYRMIYPFEARIYKVSAGSRTYPIIFADEEPTAIFDVLAGQGGSNTYKVYDLKGSLVRSVKADSENEAVKGLPAGIYMVNGKKMIVKQ